MDYGANDSGENESFGGCSGSLPPATFVHIESNSKDSVLLPALVELRCPMGQGSETAVEFAIKLENLHAANDHT